MPVAGWAIARFGTPEISNTDQGAQFSSRAWINRLKEHGIRISMDGKSGAWQRIHQAPVAQPLVYGLTLGFEARDALKGGRIAHFRPPSACWGMACASS